ncbi:PP2C family serine/threonine-protein phosphatase [Actinoplanes sp. NPDC026670]|uniref:PP2C family protein-serine/threonine phosphatase n=1 Tax=Actinoplanes sp. NPDC026670 TaxID=3154700 RepID=UPI0033F8F2EA
MEVTASDWVLGQRLLSATAATIVGNRYPANFDVLHLDEGRPLAVVADGMGDGPGSTAAGRTAVEVFVRETAGGTLSAAGATPTAWTGPAVLRSAVAEVQRAVRAAGRDIAGLTGCTLTAFAGDVDGSAWLVQLGDSRAYRLRDGVFELLTSDHTAAWLGILNGWYAPDSREAYRDRHHLTRYAGHPGMPEPDLLNVSLRPGDRFLLCTDGVSDQLHDRRLADALTERTTVVELLAETLDGGGDDNATAVIIQVS